MQPYEPTPDEIAAACEQIRQRWPESRLRRGELYEELDSIPEVHRVHDGMVRREERGRV